MNHTLFDYFRFPADAFRSASSDTGSGSDGFFRFGSQIVCYGQCMSGVAERMNGSDLPDASKDMSLIGSDIHLPFDAAQVVDNLRLERYAKKPALDKQRIVNHPLVRQAYYSVRELMPVSVRRHFQKAYFNDWKSLAFPNWPVDFTVDIFLEELLRLSMEVSGKPKVPFIWFWPKGAPSCLIMTHDVETSAGRDFASTLMDIDESFGFKSSFQSIPEKRYEIPKAYVEEIRGRGFEFNIQDINHDGHLFEERTEFLRRAKKINEYVQMYDARGFRAGAMYRNQDWYDAFEFSYDMSVPNVAHLEPQRGGCCTVMPFFIGKILELPLTTTQDYSILHVLDDHSTGLWKKQLALIRTRNGLMSFIAHPDYLIGRRGRLLYESLLDHLRQMTDREEIWAALPRDVDRWWRDRSQMRLIARGNDWEIEGPGKERARLAYAVLDGRGRLGYEVDGVSAKQDLQR
jgi:hypothetical protein